MSTTVPRQVCITDYRGESTRVNLAVCRFAGFAARPATPSTEWPRLYGRWLADRLRMGQPIELWVTVTGIWLAVMGDAGVSINVDQLRDLQPAPATTTTTTPPPWAADPPPAPGQDGPFDGSKFRWRSKVIEFDRSERRLFRLLLAAWPAFRLRMRMPVDLVASRMADAGGSSVDRRTLVNYARELSELLAMKLEFPTRIVVDEGYVRWVDHADS